jgi:hypothetical protein
MKLPPVGPALLKLLLGLVVALYSVGLAVPHALFAEVGVGRITKL